MSDRYAFHADLGGQPGHGPVTAGSRLGRSGATAVFG